MLDGSLYLKTTDSCALCADQGKNEGRLEYEDRIQLGETTLVLVESGQILPMKKDPNKPRFYADWLKPPDKQPLVVNTFVFHFQCMHEIMSDQNMDWNSIARDSSCWCCGHSFRSDRWAHRYTIGDIGKNNEFEQDVEVNLEYRPLMCSHCTALVFGQGDAEHGDSLLNGGYQQAHGR